MAKYAIHIFGVSSHIPTVRAYLAECQGWIVRFYVPHVGTSIVAVALLDVGPVDLFNEHIGGKGFVVLACPIQLLACIGA